MEHSCELHEVPHVNATHRHRAPFPLSLSPCTSLSLSPCVARAAAIDFAGCLVLRTARWLVGSLPPYWHFIKILHATCNTQATRMQQTNKINTKQKRILLQRLGIVFGRNDLQSDFISCQFL